MPGHTVRESILLIFVEDDNNGSDCPPHDPVLFDIDFSLMKAAQGLPQVDPIEKRGCHGENTALLFRKQAPPFLLEKLAVILNHDIFRGIGTDTLAVKSPEPLTWKPFAGSLSHGQPDRSLPGLVYSPPDANSPGSDKDLVSRNLEGGEVCPLLDPRIMGSKPPHGITEIVVHTGPCTGEEMVEIR